MTMKGGCHIFPPHSSLFPAAERTKGFTREQHAASFLQKFRKEKYIIIFYFISANGMWHENTRDFT